MEICFIKLNLLPLIIFFIVSQATFATDTIRILNIGGANTYIEHRLTKPYTPKTNGMLERVNGKVKANVLDKIKFNNEKEMATAIFTYFYNYNYYIKHSSIGRLTPIEKLEELLADKNKKALDISKENCYNNSVKILDDFNSKNKQILNNYSTTPDKKALSHFMV